MKRTIATPVAAIEGEQKAIQTKANLTATIDRHEAVLREIDALAAESEKRLLSNDLPPDEIDAAVQDHKLIVEQKNRMTARIKSLKVKMDEAVAAHAAAVQELNNYGDKPMEKDEIAARRAEEAKSLAEMEVRKLIEARRKALAEKWPDAFAMLDDILLRGIDAVKADRDAIKEANPLPEKENL